MNRQNSVCSQVCQLQALSKFAPPSAAFPAGSERQKAAETEGDRLKEAQAINKSLFTLGQVSQGFAPYTLG